MNRKKFQELSIGEQFTIPAFPDISWKRLPGDCFQAECDKPIGKSQVKFMVFCPYEMVILN